MQEAVYHQYNIGSRLYQRLEQQTTTIFVYLFILL